MPFDKYDQLLSDLPPATTDSDNTDADVDNVDVDTEVHDDEEVHEDTDTTDADADADADAGGDEESSDADGDADADAEVSEDSDSDSLANDRGDERTLPKWAKSLIKEKPELAASIKALHFGNQRYAKFGTAPQVQKFKEVIDAYGSVEKALEFKQKVDSIGGEQGFQESLDELGEWRNVNQEWVNADPKFLDRLIKDDAAHGTNNYSTLMPQAMIKWAQTDRAAYSHVIAQATMNTLAQNGTLNGLDLVRQALESGNTERAKTILGQINEALDGVYQLSARAPEQKAKTVSPEQERYTKGLEEVQTQKMAMFDSKVGAQNYSWINPSIKKEFTAIAKGKTVSDNFYQRYEKDVIDELLGIMGSNETFMKQRNALRAKGDEAGVIRLWKQYATPLIPKVTRNVAKTFDILGNAGAKAAAPKAKTTTTTSSAKAEFKIVQSFPDPKKVDKRKTTEDMMDRNEFVLTDGTKVKVRFPKAK